MVQLRYTHWLSVDADDAQQQEEDIRRQRPINYFNQEQKFKIK